MRQIIDLDIRFDALAFDQPRAVQTDLPAFSSTRLATIHQPVGIGKPYARARRAFADQGRQSQPAHALGKRFAVGIGARVHQHDDVAAKRRLHVPDASFAAILLIAPRAPHQFFDHDGIDIAAVVLTHVDDQAFAVVDGIKIACKIGNIGGGHRTQMQVTEAAPGCRFDTLAPLPHPIVALEFGFARARRGRDDHFARRLTASAQFQQYLSARRVAQVYGDIRQIFHRLIVERDDHIASLCAHAGPRQRRQTADQLRVAEIESRDAHAALRHILQ